MASSVGGVLSGVNPFHYNASAPYTLFLIQACIILVLSNGIHAVMSRMRQPKVISEVLAGVILGPTAFGQIPHYTETIFPKSSIPGLTLVANLGIILFMFFLGLEVDNGFIRQNGRTALSIGLATLAVPFGFGCLFALPLYNNYMKSDDTPEVKFTVFMVFIAVSFAVTAFPVLCRILAELRLVKERVGVIVLTAGTMNDVVGWTLLALCIILSNSQSDPVNVVYILLCTAGWILLYVFPLRYALRWCLVKTNELKREKPSSLSTLCILVLAFLSAYFTDIIGVHPIFGAFIAGLIVPREEGYVIKLAERMEDIPNLVMIPIYFTIAGLNVNLTLLNKGRDWGFAIASIAIAVATKALSGALLSKFHGLFWRESFAVGVLMSCKGIVEIVVLSTGLNAGIISEKVYAMFIFMALISTFITTPLTVWILPESYRDKVEDILSEQRAKEHKECEVEGESTGAFSFPEKWPIQRIVVVLNDAESLAATLSVLQCIIGAHHNHFYTPSKECVTRIITKDEEAHTLCASPTVKHIENEADLVVKTLYLRQLTDRTTDVISTSSVENSKQLLASDSTLRTFKIFADLFSIRYDNETMFSNAREKVLNIASIPFSASDILLFPLKGNLDVKEPWLSDGLGQKTSDIMQRLGSQNELPEDFVNKLATSVKTNVVLYFANQDQELTTEQTKESEQIILILPSSSLVSSDYLALFLTLIVYQGHRRNGKLAELFILCNQKNKDSRRILDQWFAAFEVSDARLQGIEVAGNLDCDDSEGESSLSKTSTASPKLMSLLSNDARTVVFVGDSEFYRKGKLNSSSLDLVSASSHFKADLVICNHPPSLTCCEQS